MNPTNRERVILLENAKRAARRREEEVLPPTECQESLHSGLACAAYCLFSALLGAVLMLGAIVWLWR